MSTFLDPKFDLVFKKIFHHKELLKDFLNSVMPIADDIEDLEYLSPEQVPELPGQLKLSIVDVMCQDVKGRKFIVEMQLFWHEGFDKRILFSAGKAYVNQLDVGKTYNYLQPVYSLAIINGVFDHETNDWYHHYEIVNVLNTTQKLEGLQFVFIELPKFNTEQPLTVSGKLLDKALGRKMKWLWLQFLREINEKTIDAPPELLQDPFVKQAVEMARTSGFTKAELQGYDKELDGQRTYMTAIESERKLAHGEGKAEGKQEIAKDMLAAGFDDAQIAQLTRLSIEQIKALRGE